ncbi:GGDEF domain-containing protein [Methylocystis sp. ATCC 49242]|uniref:GGDEF domain-containing protein n=1 Tax=Methylocystis sp. ATCC 49242 TaxID=622637 RepID=UPI0001F86F4A|nr:GGDEF domain-containing protein [Methylocystis sp. ATCC 49242]
MFASIWRVKEPRTRRDALRLVLLYAAISVSVSALVTAAFARMNGWPLGPALIPAIGIPLLVAPWMTWTVASAALRLHEMRQELERLARIDPLSGALNRRGLAEFAARHFAERRESGKFCAIVADVDRFKTINDAFGHAAGDAVIARVADIMRLIVGTRDCAVGRFGGDELGALIVGLSLEETMILAENLRAAIERTIFLHGDRRIPVTTSIGVAAVDVDDATPEAMLNRADQSLYAAKEAGRNRVRASLSRRAA